MLFPTVVPRRHFRRTLMKRALMLLIVSLIAVPVLAQSASKVGRPYAAIAVSATIGDNGLPGDCPTGPATCAGCKDTFDPNGDGVIDSADVFYLVAFIYEGGPAPV